MGGALAGGARTHRIRRPGGGAVRGRPGRADAGPGMDLAVLEHLVAPGCEPGLELVDHRIVDRELLPLLAGVVLAQRMADELVVVEQALEGGMAGEDDAVLVPGLALRPIRGLE